MSVQVAVQDPANRSIISRSLWEGACAAQGHREDLALRDVLGHADIKPFLDSLNRFRKSVGTCLVSGLAECAEPL